MRRPLAVLLLTAALAVPSVGLAAASTPTTEARTSSGPVARSAADPRTTRPLYVNPDQQSARAAAQNSIFDPIGSQPQPMWVSEYFKVDQVAGAVRSYVRAAAKAGATPLLSIYAIPGRDCGSASAGGQPDGATYRAWIDKIARGITGSKPLVIIEPDALPYIGMSWCTFDVDERIALLRYAVTRLTKAGAWTYLDAGNSTWHTAGEMASLLQRAGVSRARGFSSNVANYRTTKAERRHDDAIVAALKKKGITGVHYVIDTGRNGVKPKSKEWCNAPWARLGKPPTLLFEGAFDGRLWVKSPGESDGQTSDDTCHGGPPAGQWWPEGAKRLMGLAGS